MADEFKIKDSGERAAFASGMVRDSGDKTDYTNVLHGPMLDRWAEHCTKGREKYPDPALGVPNWTLAAGEEELIRFKQSFLRHAIQWLRGDRDEDHAAALFFNINGAEYVRDKLIAEDLEQLKEEWTPSAVGAPGLDNGPEEDEDGKGIDHIHPA